MARLRNEYEYLALLEKTLTYGEVRNDRTGVGTVSIFGEQLKFDISNSIPSWIKFFFSIYNLAIVDWATHKKI